MSIGLISHPDCLLHDMGHSLPEIPERLLVIEKELIRSGLYADLKKYTAIKATYEQLLRVHHREYIDYIFLSSPKEGTIPLDPDTWMNPHTLNAALYAAGEVTQGVDLVLSGEVNAVYCNVRPPGHHAEKQTAMGFCFFNNIAVGAAHAIHHHQLKKVAIVDFDAHHGNGIEDIFKNDANVLYCSSFEHPFYPFSGADTRSSHIINIPLAAGTTGKLFCQKAKEQWFRAIEDFKPEMIFFSAGFDANDQDDMSDLFFTVEDYAWITSEIMKIARKVCQGRVVSALEGGYSLETLGLCVEAHVRALG